MDILASYMFRFLGEIAKVSEKLEIPRIYPVISRTEDQDQDLIPSIF